MRGGGIVGRRGGRKEREEGRRAGRERGEREEGKKGRRGEREEGDVKPAWIHRASPHILMVLPVVGGGKFKVQR